MGILIFNADDYGLSPGVCRGIIATARGVVRSTTVMANFVTPEQAGLLRNSTLHCGAHLNLSSGTPLSAYPAQLLRPDGTFDKDKALDAFTWEDEELRAAAVAEWAAQLARLYELKLPVEHLDSHHHTHMVGYLFADAARFASENGLPLRCRHMMRRYLQDVGVAGPHDLLENFFGYGHISKEALLQTLSHVRGEIVEVMCHPGYVDVELRDRSSYLGERERELELLGDRDFARELASYGWQLGSYAALG